MTAMKGLIWDLIGVGFPNTTTPGFNSHTVDAANDGIALLVQLLDTTPVTHLLFRYGGFGAGVPPTFLVAFEAPASTGNPDGTPRGGGSPASATFTPPADTSIDGLMQEVALANAYTPAGRAEENYITIRYSSGTINGSNFSTFTTDITNVAASSLHMYPPGNRLTGGTWAKRTQPPYVCGWKTDDGNYHGFPIESYYNTRTASTVGHRQAVKFNLPGTGTFKLLGMEFAGSIAGATGKTPKFGLWNAAGTLLQSFSLDSDTVSAPTSSYRSYRIKCADATLATLSFGTDYYFGIEVVDATNGDVLINGITVGNANHQKAFPGGNTVCISNWTGAAWSDVTTARPWAKLMFDDISASGGSGGGSIFGGSGIVARK